MAADERAKTIVVFLILGTGITLGRVCTAELTIWDDDKVLVNNPRINPPTLSGVVWFWGHPQFEMYIPMTYSVWTLLAMGLGMNGWVFHTANLVVHVLAVLAVFGLLRLLLRPLGNTRSTDWGAAAGALLFAIHPLQVEPVAWGTGLKDVMCGALAIFAVWEYLRVASGCAWPRLHYFLGTGCFVLAMLSKPAGAATPLLAGALDLFILRRPLRSVLRTLWPWLLLSGLGAIVAKWAQPVSDVISPPLWARPFIAGDTLAFYLYKLVFPAHLTIDYGRSPRVMMGHWWFYTTWLFPAAIAMALWVWRRGRRWLGTAGLILLLGVLPVLGLISFHTEGWSTVCDHYMYMAMTGPALAMAWVLGRYPRPYLFISAAVMLTALAVRSTLQAGYWKNSENLFSHAINVNPNDLRSHNNYGLVLLNHAAAARAAGRPAERRELLRRAEAEFRTAVKIEPARLYCQENFIRTLRLEGREKDAIKHMSPLLPGAPPLSPRQWERYGPLLPVLGEMLLNQGRYGEAVGVYGQYLRLHPEDTAARSALAASMSANIATRPATTD